MNGVKQQQKYDGNALLGILGGAKPKNPKRRLFVDDEKVPSNGNHHSFVPISSPPGHELKVNTRSSNSSGSSSGQRQNSSNANHVAKPVPLSTQSYAQNTGQQKGRRVTLMDQIYIPSWQNFHFDMDPIVRAIKR